MRIAVAHIAQETDTFNPTPATMSDFEAYGYLRGQELLDQMTGIGTVGGFLEAVGNSADKIEVVPLINAYAVAGGRVSRPTLDAITADLMEQLEAAVASGPLDGFAFLMHGACAADGMDDVEGYLLAKAREILGPDLPIAVGLDHHANVTAAMVELSTSIVAHRTQPHEPYDTGRATGELLFPAVAGRTRPVMAFRKLRMLSHQEQYLTRSGPMKTWFDRARALEQEDGILSVSPFPMQPWLDLDEGGWAVVVVADGDQQLAEQAADEMADLAWSLRAEYLVTTSVTPAEAVAQAAAHDGLVIISDTGDSVFGGSAGDSNVLLGELLAAGGPTALLPMVDPDAAHALVAAGPGATVDVGLGGAVSRWYEPLNLRVKVLYVHPDLILYPGSGSFGYDSARHGATAVVQVGCATLVVSERCGIAGNFPALYEVFGLNPADYGAVVLKTASNFQWYKDLTTEVIRANTPGPTQSDLLTLPWKRVPRPIFPLDSIDDWR